MSQNGMVLIGAGETGARAAFTLRENGCEDSVVLIGEEWHPPYERPPLSKGLLNDGGSPKYVASRDAYEAKGIELLTGQSALRIDTDQKTVHLQGGSVITYEKLLISTGARARPLPGIDFDGRRVFSLRTHDDAAALRPWISQRCRIAIIGGGFIGLELAASARLAGATVTVIEAQPRILMRGVPELLALRLHERHVAEGVDMRCGTAITSITVASDHVRVDLGDGTRLDADILVVGIGAVPNTDLARDAGLAIDNGIVVDEFLRTSDPNIFAAGDCCNFPLSVYGGRRVRLESWRNAQEQGTIAALNMLGRPTEVTAVPWFWSDQ